MSFSIVTMISFTSQKARELWQLWRFRESCPAFPGGSVCIDEQPDFVVRHGGELLGIELTDYYRAPLPGEKPMQEVESLSRQIVAQARKLYDERGGFPVEIAVHFSPYTSVTKRLVPQCAKELAELVGRTRVDVGTVVYLEHTGETRKRLPGWISVLRILRLPDMTTSHWTVPAAAYVPECSVEEIQQRIDEKDALYESYRRKCDAVWLLIVSDGFALSSIVDLPEGTRIHRYKTKFEAVFFFDNFRKKGVILPIERTDS